MSHLISIECINVFFKLSKKTTTKFKKYVTLHLTGDFMSKFKPLHSQQEKIMDGDWVGFIQIDPPLNKAETDFLRKYLNTYHFNYSDDEFSGLYFCHNDKEISTLEVVDDRGRQEKFFKKRQVHVPSLTSPLVLGYINDSENVNAIGLKTYSNGIYQAELWVDFIIQHFFAKDAIAKTTFTDFNFFEHHVLNGELCYSVQFVSEEKPRFFNCSVVNNKVYKYVLALPVPILSKDFQDKITRKQEKEKQISGIFSQFKMRKSISPSYKAYYLNPFKAGGLPFNIYYAPNFNGRDVLEYKMTATIKGVLNNNQKFKRFTDPKEIVMPIENYLSIKYEESFMKAQIITIPKTTVKKKLVKF